MSIWESYQDWRERRRDRRIEDEERWHRHSVEMVYGSNPQDVNRALSSQRAAIVALQAENKQLRDYITNLEKAIWGATDSLWQERAHICDRLNAIEDALRQRRP